jgi:hypothetical protein
VKPIWAAALLAAMEACAPAAGPATGPSTTGAQLAPRDLDATILAAPPGAMAETDAQRRVADFLARVAAVRHLQPRAAVQARVLDRAALIASVRQHVAREVPPDVIHNQGELLVGFGMVLPDFDYEEGAFKLLEAQLAGFYEPSDKRMYLASDLTDRAADATLAHELVHALQDQYYDLGARLSYQPEANDRESAIQALAEGDATSAMMDLMFAESGRRSTDVPDDVFAAEVESSMTSTPDGAGVPRVLRASLVAPYVDGVTFVNALRRRGLSKRGAAGGGWETVDEAWRSPPGTTEQLLHLDKYDAREPAEALPVPVSPPGSWTILYDDGFGEEGLRIAVEEWMSKKAAQLLAGGWAGDRVVLFRRSPSAAGSAGPGAGPTLAVAWHIRFDRGPGQDFDAEARQAFKTLAAAFPAVTPAVSSFCVDRGSLGPLAVVRTGRDLAIVGGPYRRAGNRVVPDAVCTQSVRWAADILSRSKQ